MSVNNKVGYDSIIQDLWDNDPDFRNLDPDSQDKIVEELAQERFGIIPKTEGFLERVIRMSSPKDRFATPVGFIPRNQEELSDVPSIVSDQFPVDYGRAAMSGILSLNPGSREIVNSFPELKPKTTYGKTVSGAGNVAQSLVAAGELGKVGFDIAKGIGGNILKSVFKRQIADAKLPEASDNLTESIQDVIRKSKESIQDVFSHTEMKSAPIAKEGLSVHKNKLIDYMKNEFGKVKNQSGGQAATFRRWLKILESGPENVDAETLSQIESGFGHVAKFGVETSTPELTKAARNVNRFASGLMDEVAINAGNPEFVTRSAEKSNLLRNRKASSSFWEAIFPPIKRAKKVVGDSGKEFFKKM